MAYKGLHDKKNIDLYQKKSYKGVYTIENVRGTWRSATISYPRHSKFYPFTGC